MAVDGLDPVAIHEGERECIADPVYVADIIYVFIGVRVIVVRHGLEIR